jgi:hypothetical protein
MICEHADAFETEINQDLRSDAAFMLNQALAGEVAVKLAARMVQNPWKLARRCRG